MECAHWHFTSAREVNAERVEIRAVEMVDGCAIQSAADSGASSRWGFGQSQVTNQVHNHRDLERASNQACRPWIRRTSIALNPGLKLMYS
jgi:hypothetical protein